MNQKPKLTILLVEDHEDTREAMKYWLERQGYAVLAANTLKTALALGRKEAFDLLLSDLKLPDGDGWELMRQLRALKPVVGIATSGHCASSDIGKSIECGYVEHLIKPYPVEELTAAISHAQQEISRRGRATE